ncbi:adenosylmethionine--8-amino-7-oxononanoate transaminase [Geodermatophilus chilensis]|uniref:adenosylmethionine--8-amino-7-oxononanoate transaminase n=1 Tax=Geodermatophilus chilensis TaxID=2035835 RepID=UPI001E29DBDE|nr:adenosylmethionine--8-amino-7-oxononanoate transaminase [Geodermatophilus chilensis]
MTTARGELAAGPDADLGRLLAVDRAHLWHPYASMTAPSPVRVVESAEGARLRLAGYGDVIDGMSSWWCAIHGYRHPVLDAAARDQLASMSHVMFGGLTHAPAVGLVERLLALAPDPLRHVFLCDSGSVAVEVALKMALQRAVGRGQPRRRRQFTVRGGYHGDTFDAMSVCDPVGGMHSLFAGVLPEQVFAPRPPGGFDRAPGDAELDAWTAETTRLFEQHAADLAAVIVEPVLQGAGGMHVYSPECLRVLRRLCDDHEVPLILDEIATGFGRTGTMFAAEHAGVVPDILCVGKALTGGYLSLAAVLCTTAVAEEVCAQPAGALMHGPTFMANPLACAVASASLDLLTGQDWAAGIDRIERGLTEGLASAADLPGVADVRVLGAVGVVQTRTPVDVARATEAALAAGVWLRPFRDLVYTMPPYISSEDDVATISRGVVAAVRAVAS